MRKTKTRSAILSIFEKDPKPLSVQDLLSLLSNKNLHVNKTTVYRELSFLKDKALVREVIWDDSVVRFEKNDPHCHHHVVCKSCGKVEPIRVDELSVFSDVKKQSHFQLESHIMEFFGLCPNCK